MCIEGTVSAVPRNDEAPGDDVAVAVGDTQELLQPKIGRVERDLVGDARCAEKLYVVAFEARPGRYLKFLDWSPDDGPNRGLPSVA